MRKRLIGIVIIMVLTSGIYSLAWAKEAETEQDSADLPEIECHSGEVEALIESAEDYEKLIDQLEEYPDCYTLTLDMGGTDTAVCLNEITAYRNIRYIHIENGGSIVYKHTHELTSTVNEVELTYVFSIDNELFESIRSGSLRVETLRLELDDRYMCQDTLPLRELLYDMPYRNMILFWDGKDVWPAAQENMEKLREWAHLQSVQDAAGAGLRGIYRLREDDYSYASYEFYYVPQGYQWQWELQAAAASLSIWDTEGAGTGYFDMEELPADRFQGGGWQVFRIRQERLSTADDLNFDGYRDLVFDGKGGAPYCGRYTVYLWDEEQKRFVREDSAPDYYEQTCFDRGREELQIAGSLLFEEVSRIVFLEFDFYRKG